MAGQRPIHVMSVDDDRINQMVVGRALSSGNFRHSVAMTAEDALGMLAELHTTSGYTDFPDIILMDVNLPGASGIEATKAVRSYYPDANIRVIMVTAESSPEATQSCAAAGCNGFLGKPVTPASLSQCIQEVLGM
mmetsp:Transcript_15634/g.43734  ORF Transcript_15634/g.43734 Transcript_15634/m.43734 type:complete len:135 (+) Transcript_15634:451-855(+)|eukprot:CAMPEP_0117675592 /NCGR_PEP_ID=MMETSP0804-20121206/15693_1 /TAXON_ID=1074897 /ORGANISM="Tetraselmis astigmatica, Strain CCMP880" /LENGTH=134 /DNA_ID=CAMNT_0005484617 /DNA_START=347 /DNA_END=751 /DNA_ORIENTATION=+